MDGVAEADQTEQRMVGLKDPSWARMMVQMKNIQQKIRRLQGGQDDDSADGISEGTTEGWFQRRSGRGLA